MEETELVTTQSLQCKNCGQPLNSKDKFCGNCSAKIIPYRITFRNLMADMFRNTLGWDNKYLYTIKSLVTKPEIVLRKYINGTRKKYVHPFTFLAIGMTIAIFIFNTYDDEYISSNQSFQKAQLEWMSETIGGPYTSIKFQKEQLENSESSTKFMLKYLNFLVVLLLPIYSFLAFLVYRKPLNFGEHVVVNSYVQGLSFLSISVLFLVSLVTHPLVYTSNILLLICFYTYVYGKLYSLSLIQSLFKVFIFFLIGIGGLIFLYLIAFAFGLATKFFS